MPHREPRTTIAAYAGGPLLVRGPVEILGEDGQALTQRRSTIALCTCGRSRLRPLCDGTHAAARALGASEERQPIDSRCEA